jgi:site-specific DNA recombinase
MLQQLRMKVMNCWKEDLNKSATVVIRRSGQGQRDNTSAETQETAIKEYCHRHGLSIVDTNSIIETAYSRRKRHRYQKILDRVLNENVRHIVFYHSSRETRNMTDHERHEDLAKAGEIILHHVVDNKVYWSGTPASEWTAKAFHVVIDKGESADKSERYKASYLTKARNGWWPYRHTPLGYIHKSDLDKYGSPIRGTAKLTPVTNQKEIQQVKREFYLRSKGHSYDQIAEQMFEEGWITGGRSKSGYRSTLTKRLQNPIYWGWFYLKDNPERFEGKHELIISKEILAAVQNVNEGRYKAATRDVNHGIFSGGWLRCGHPECQLQITYEPKTKLIKSTQAEKTYHYYRCTNQRRIHQKTTYVSEEKIIKQFEESIPEFEITEEFAKDIMDYLNKTHQRAVQAHRKQAEGHRSALKDLEKREDAVIDLLVAGTIPKDSFDRKIQSLREQRDFYNRQLEDLNILISDESHISVKRILELSISAKSLFKSMNKQEKVEYLKIVYSNPTLDRLSVQYQLQKPFEWLAKNKENKNWRRGGDSNPR